MLLEKVRIQGIGLEMFEPAVENTTFLLRKIFRIAGIIRVAGIIGGRALYEEIRYFNLD